MIGSLSPKRVARNAAALYSVQIASFLVPVFEIPILARAFGATLYGQILFCQALALTASLLVEYGFNINAAQQVALVRDSRHNLTSLFSQVLLAKGLLAIPLMILLATVWWSGALRTYLDHTELLWFTIAYFLAFGFSPMWYFQGLEKMAAPALLDVGLRLIGLGILAINVHKPGDFLLALPILCIPPLANTCLTTVWSWRQVAPLHWDPKGAWKQIHDGFHFFVYRSASSLAASVIPVFLGFSAGKTAVGEFAPPEKLVKGMASLALPFLSAAFPAFSRILVADDKRTGIGVSISILSGIAILSLMGTGIAAWAGPWVMTVLLGGGFPGSLDIYYILLGVAPLRIINQSIALILLIPSGKSKPATYAISICSILAVLAGTGLSIWKGGPGMAIGLVGMEALLTVAMVAMAINLLRQVAHSDSDVPKPETRL